jgi:hypothetical protein
MTHSRHERLLDYAAQRARTRPDYLGWVFARYIERERISEAEVATRLGAPLADLPRLALCLRPRAGHFTEDLRQISSRFQIDAAALAGIVRLVESLDSFSPPHPATPSADAGLLLAARARKRPGNAQDDEGGEHDAGRS